MPVSRKTKAKAGKRGAKTTRDSASEKKAKRLEDGFTAAERCAKRLARHNRARRDARDNRDLTLGEQVLRNPLIRDLSIQGVNPYKLSDLQHLLNLRGFYKLLPDVDLKECYFEGACGFRKDEFVLANWREMTVEEIKEEVTYAHPEFGRRRVYPPGKVDVDTLETKEEIVRAFWTLTYVPEPVYRTAVAGAHVLRSLKAGDVGEDPFVVRSYLYAACCAGLDLPVIRGLAEKCGKREINYAAKEVAERGHTDVLDLLASEFGARIGEDCLTGAAESGRDAMIDHLVEEYGLDLYGVDGYEWTALQKAASRGRVRTVKHLVEKHNVDIHKRHRYGWTALYQAEWSGMTECAAYLCELTYTQLLAGEYRRDVDVELFMSAAKRGHDAMIDLLVERYGLDPNGADGDGWTALHRATEYGRVGTVKHLVEKHNVDIHKRSRGGVSALDQAEENGMTECAAYLRELTYTQLLAGEYRGDIDVALLVSAAERGDDAMIDLLVEEYGVDPNAGDDYGWTALHRATEYGRVRTVKHLVEKHNVDIHKRTENDEGNDEETALDLAERNGMKECAAVLRGYGATNGEPVEEEDWTESDDWDSDDNSGADHDVM